ncbi:PKD-like family lipoprotein [Lutibacter sp. A64]|uniref:PKD-like family lipoprotein n=1 Tax=Lutibacter sp. A64 TaxID=2918526 RepID=UPI001F06BB14|nr:PKD-like family lipoprotein [Lutibacter sp. A64]UMB52503.1 PKD-like family lipoprotein [Lutibacter sp. A64]
MTKGNVLAADRQKDLATTKNLQLDALSIPPASYEVFYRVTDKNTGIQWSTSFNLNVESTIYQGWLIMNDVNGTARLDMISKLTDDELIMHDVLALSGSSLVLEGAPGNVYCYPYDPTFYGIYVTSEETGTTKIHPETFDWETEYYLSFEMLSSVPTDFKADFIKMLPFGSESLMYKDGNYYYYLRVYQYRYGVPINIVDGEVNTFKASPYVGTAGVMGESILYDEDNKRFVRHPWASLKSNVFPEGTLFDYNIDMDLVFMDRTEYNGGEVFAILKDNPSNKLYLARMSSGFFGNISQRYFEEIPTEIAEDMALAEHFAISPQFGYLFYNVGSKIYEYDFGIKQSKLMIDKGTEEITQLKFSKFSYPNNEPQSLYTNQLLVASYNSGESNGTLEFYEVPPVNGDLILTESYDGFGKIVSTSFRER